MGYLPDISSKREVIFTAEEKRRAIELLLEHEEVIRTLDDVIFKKKYQQGLEEKTNLFKVEGSSKAKPHGPLDDVVSTATHQAFSDQLPHSHYNALMQNPYERCVKPPKKVRNARSLKTSATQSRTRIEGKLSVVPEGVLEK